MHGLLITGTDTDVGKTYVTAQIARELRSAGHKVGVFKPACSGAEFDAAGEPYWSDVEAHFDALDGEFPRELICPNLFRDPLAPPVAAQREGREIELDSSLRGIESWKDRVDLLLIEGVGGFLCPLTRTETIADFAAVLRIPVVVVARLGLGTINHTLLTLAAIRSHDLTPAGIILNRTAGGPESLAEATNVAELAQRTDVPILSVVEYRQTDWLRAGPGAPTIDWFSLAGPVS